MAKSKNTTRSASTTRVAPKPPPGSVESIRRQTSELKSATALLGAAKVVEAASTGDTYGLAMELIGGAGEEKDGMRLLCVEADRHKRLLFAITKTADMADELNEAYLKR
jgi:hypothetical protein